MRRSAKGWDQTVDNEYLKMVISLNSDDFYFLHQFYINYSEHV